MGGRGDGPAVSERRPFPWKWVAAVAVVVALVYVRSYLPIGEWLSDFNVWVAGLGTKGIVVYVVAYVAATVLFIPGSILTIGAGFLFGVMWGTVIVSVASTTGASCAFLISRYFAREWVAKKAEASPRFGAIDRAIGEQGWKIVGLLRLSPAIPFSLSNYLYGLTAVRFVPYVIASWAGMIPGTVLYTYLGVAGKAGLQATAGGVEKSTQEYVFLAVGLVATIAVTVMITRIAQRALKEAST